MKPKVYLDTAYFDERTPDRRRLTSEFWSRRLIDFDPVVSSIVLLEIRDTGDIERRSKMEKLIRGIPVLPFTAEADALAHDYVQKGIFPEKYIGDANHVAIAVINHIPYFVSWNFTHLVKVNTRRGVNLVNALLGLEPIEIVAPPEL